MIETGVNASASGNSGLRHSVVLVANGSDIASQPFVPIIEQHGGVILSVTAEHLVAGYNLIHDLPLASYLAVQTGLTMHKTDPSPNSSLANLRVGIYQDTVSVSEIEGSPSLKVTGEALTTAQLLCKNAEPGEIVVSLDIYDEISALPNDFEVKQVLELPIAGHNQPIVIYRLIPAHHQTPLPHTLDSLIVHQSGSQILVAEDSPNLRAVFAKVFKHAGFTVSVAANGYEVLSYLSRSLPDVLVLDIGLPGHSGLDIIRHIRQQETSKRVFIIIVTGNHLAEQTPEAQEADLFLIKPVSTRDLVSLVKRYTTH